MGGPHQQPQVETDSEGEQTPRPNTSRRRSVSSGSSLTARRESKTEPRRTSDKNSDSGYSTGTKASADSVPNGKPLVEKVEPAQMPPPPSPRRSSRPPMETRMSSSRSQTSERSSTKSARPPSRAPSTKSKSTTRSDRRKEEPCPAGCEDCKKERKQSRNVETSYPPGAYPSARTSPTSSRSSRAPSSSSQEMPPPASTVRPRPRSGSMSRAGRPASYSGVESLESYYPPSLATFDHGPPPSRSAYADKGMYPPVRPALNVLPSPQSYAPSVHPSQALQRSWHDPSRMAIRTQTEYSTASTASSGTQYSARRPVSVYQDLPRSYDPTTVTPPSPESASPTRERKIVSARQPAYPPPYDQLEDDSSESDSEPDEEDDPPPQYMPIRRTGSVRERSANIPRMRGGAAIPGGYAAVSPFGTSPYGTSPASAFPAYDSYHEDPYTTEYRGRSNATNSSSDSRRQSVASSGVGTRGTSYSASSGSGGNAAQRRRSVYDPQQYGTSPLDTKQNQAEAYINNVDRQASHTRYQQPKLTQESLRQQEARAIKAKQSSKGASVVSSQATSNRTRTVMAGDEQSVKLVFNTAQGVDLALEGDTDRPIKWVQKPGEQTAQLIIGTGNSRREETVYNDGSSAKSSGRSGGSRVSGSKASSKAAVSGRRERARTDVR